MILETEASTYFHPDTSFLDGSVSTLNLCMTSRQIAFFASVVKTAWLEFSVIEALG